MVRLQRVTFFALNQFLGLGRELLNQVRMPLCIFDLLINNCYYKKPSLNGEYSVYKLQQNSSKPVDVQGAAADESKDMLSPDSDSSSGR